LEFDRDRACDYLETQYMLGESLLVAPVFNSDGRVDYYLPKGEWTNFISNQKVTGGTWQYEKHDFMSLPLMVRPNSIIAVGNNENVPDYDYLDGTTLHVFELSNNEPAAAIIYTMEGKAGGSVQAVRNGNSVTITVEGLKNCSIIMRNINNIADLAGASFESDPLGSKLAPNGASKEISFKIV
ncbi:MAG: family 31 glycosyl hydrolase, alpha-glucosidase, partial [Eubacterium sp.]|nr:family 31 glycosyl hydrolase, alpha-glucosidase [Eubacterium sp.]